MVTRLDHPPILGKQKQKRTTILKISQGFLADQTNNKALKVDQTVRDQGR